MGYPLAIRYNDRSVVENYCLTQCFKAMMDPASDILGTLTEQQYWCLRESIIDCVLFADISHHFQNLSTISLNPTPSIDEFESRMKSSKFPSELGNDAQMIMNFGLYAAIHSTPARLTQSYARYFFNRVEELYQVGDLEKKALLRVDFFFDRTVSNPYELEKGYIEVMARPVLELWCKFLPNLRAELIDKNLNENAKFLEKEREEAEKRIKRAAVDESSINLKLLPDNSVDK